MGLQLDDLNERTRQFMLEEVALDIAEGSLYLSERLNERGLTEYAGLLQSAIESGDDDSLAKLIREGNYLNPTLQRRNPKGGFSTARMPSNAAQTLAEGEFNRFYIRGLCRRVIEDSITDLEVYRARASRNPRPESQAMIGRRINAKALLEDLRTTQGVDTALGLPPGPNSGLSARTPKSPS